MPTYQYTVRDATGETRTGTSEAEDQASLYKRLKEQGFTASRITPASVRRVLASRKDKGATGERDYAAFWQQLALLLEGEVPLPHAMNVAAEQVPAGRFHDVVKDMTVFVESGYSLSRALQRHPVVFGPYTIGLIKAGEASRNLRAASRHLADLHTQRMLQQQQMRVLLKYALIVIITAAVVFRLLWLK